MYKYLALAIITIILGFLVAYFRMKLHGEDPEKFKYWGDVAVSNFIVGYAVAVIGDLSYFGSK